METKKTIIAELAGNYQMDIVKPCNKVVNGEIIEDTELIGIVKLNHLSIEQICTATAIYNACVDEEKTAYEQLIEIGKFMFESVVTEYSSLFDEPQNAFKKISMLHAIVDKGYLSNMESAYIAKKKE